MMPRRPQHIGEVIAERKLSVVGRPDLQITVRIGKPRELQELFEDGKLNKDMFCPFQIVGLGDEAVRYAAGVDAVQALQLVMRMVGPQLDALANDNSLVFRWLDQSDLGFPIE